RVVNDAGLSGCKERSEQEQKSEVPHTIHYAGLAFRLTTMRLDQAIAARFPEISRRKARELLAAKRVLVNERLVGVASREVSESDRIAVVEEAHQLVVIKAPETWMACHTRAGTPAHLRRDPQPR